MESTTESTMRWPMIGRLRRLVIEADRYAREGPTAARLHRRAVWATIGELTSLGMTYPQCREIIAQAERAKAVSLRP